MMALIEKLRDKSSPNVDESTATCVSFVNMLQRADDVLAMGDAHGKTDVKTELGLINEVKEAVKDLEMLMKTYQKKNRMSRVAGTALFRQRLKEAEAIVNEAFKKLHVSIVVWLLYRTSRGSWRPFGAIRAKMSKAIVVVCIPSLVL